MSDFFCAEGGTRTRTPVTAHAPETCVSTNFTTSAIKFKILNSRFKISATENLNLKFSILMVPRTGFEPAHLAALPPQSSVSTNFTTWAFELSILDTK